MQHDAGEQLKAHIAALDDALSKSGHRRLAGRLGHLGGVEVTATIERVLATTTVTIALDGAPGAELRMTPAEIQAADPGKLIVRLEAGLESLKTRTLTDLDRLITETARAADDLDKPFAQAAQLTAARDRVRQIEDQLKQAVGSHPEDHD